jgi:hypothetical protein
VTALDRLVANQILTSTQYNLMLDELERSLPRCIVKRTTTQSIPNTTSTPIVWTTEVEDTDDFFTASDDTLYVPESGTYDVEGGLNWPTAANGSRGCWIQHNGVEIEGSGNEMAGGGDGNRRHQLGATLVCAAGDAIQVYVYQSSGGAMNVTSGRLAIKKLK